MTATLTRAPALDIPDPDLIRAFIAHGPDIKTVADALDRRAFSVKRSLERAASRGLVDLETGAVPDPVRAALGDETAAARLAASPPAPASGADGTTRLIALGDLRESDFNPRKSFDPAGIAELAESILARGLIQNLKARPDPREPGAFELAAGSRRFRAMSLLAQQGRSSERFDPAKPVAVNVEDLTDADMILIGLTENRERENPHPLEEADAFKRLKDLREAEAREKGLGEREAGKVTAEIGKALGKTREFVQGRIRLAERLIPEVVEAFRDGRINFAEARAFTKCTREQQASVLPNVLQWGKGDAGYILQQITAGMVPASKVRFRREAYTGEVFEDEDTGELFYIDRAEVERLQRDIITREQIRLKGEGHAWVETIDDRYFYSYEYPEAPEKAPAGTVGAVIIFNPESLSITVFERRVKREAIQTQDQQKAREEKAAEREALAEAAKDSGVEARPEPYARRHWLAAKAAKTDALQHTLARSGTRIPMALTILASLDHMRQDDRETVRLSRIPRRGEDRGIGPSRQLTRLIGEDPCDGLKAETNGVTVTDPGRAFRALKDRADLPVLFAAAIADLTGCWAGYDPGPGDTPLMIELAGALELESAAQHMAPTQEHFALFNKGSQLMIARAMGAEIDPSQTREAIAAELARIDASRRDGEDEDEAGQPFNPPEWRFGGPLMIDTACTALLTGNLKQGKA